MRLDEGDDGDAVDNYESDDGDAVDNYNDVYFYNNRGSSGVFTGKKCGTAQQNHEMVAVGYGKDSATGLDFWVLGVYSQWCQSASECVLT